MGRDPQGAEQALIEAEKHAQSARVIAAADPNGGFQLAYDAARKAVTAKLRSDGLRIRRGEGGHVATAEYAVAELDAELGDRLERLRRRRNRSEYGTAFFTVEDVTDAVELAEALIAAMR